MNLTDELARHPYDPNWTYIERMADVLAIIETWPDLHEQRYLGYSNECGTAKCVGGWHRVRLASSYVWPDLLCESLGLERWATCDGPHVFDPQNTLAGIYRLAARAYGISKRDLRDRVAKVRAERGWL